MHLDVVRTPGKASCARALQRGIQPPCPACTALTRRPCPGHAARRRRLGTVRRPAVRALERSPEITFRARALWSEEAVGTNGPGTALALARPRPRSRCSHRRRRALLRAPARVARYGRTPDPLTQEVLGVLDLSRLQAHAHPHTLSLATAIAVAFAPRPRPRVVADIASRCCDVPARRSCRIPVTRFS